MTINDLFNIAIERNASDIHILPNHYPTFRIHGELVQLRTMMKLSNEDTKELILATLNDEQKEHLMINKELDYGHSYIVNNTTYRLRINAYFSQNSLCASFRLIPSKIKSIEELGLPPILHTITDMEQGLVLITGPTGHGKSSTLASLIQEINQKHAKHILTIEDPIEYYFPEGKSIISQRELGSDTYNWSNSLKSALREDPDIVLVGEMRDFETTQSTLTIAETGHLVLSTLHTNSASQSIDRIIDMFPPFQQNQIKIQLAATLRIILSQRLIQNMNNSGRVVAYEILIVNNAVSNIIREGKTHLIDNVIQTSHHEHMILFESSLLQLLKNQQISRDQALLHALRPKELLKLID